jgi:hypothetical protein
MSYKNMKEKIEGVVLLKPACVAGHAGATLAGRGEGYGDAPASREPSTLWGRRVGSVCDEQQLTVLGLCCWPHPSAGGQGQVARRGAESHPALWGEYHLEGWQCTE